MNLVKLFFKKSVEKITKKKVLWNLLINLSVSKDFSNKFIKSKNFNLFFEFLEKSKVQCCFKFIENVF